MALPFTLKSMLGKNEELRKLKYFTMQKYNLQKKNPLQKNQNPSSRYYNSITNLKFQHMQDTIFPKILISKLNLLYLGAKIH